MQFSYQILHQTGKLRHLQDRLRSCAVCPRHCLADRWNEVEGFCRSGRNPLVASTVAHFGEEPALVGKNGAGNIFFGSCNLRCVYCQNWQISHPRSETGTGDAFGVAPDRAAGGAGPVRGNPHPSSRHPSPSGALPLRAAGGPASATRSAEDERETRRRQDPFLRIARKNEMTVEELANRMIALQNQGCHNINFVSPSHFAAQMVEAIAIACDNGLKVPLVYNTNAYDDIETLKLLDGIIDIYLPDIKYADDLTAIKYSQARDYVQISQRAIKEMYRQVGNLELDENGLARRGLIVRHLILPNDIGGSEASLKFLAEEISREVTISVMAQYYPTNKAERIPLLSRKIRSSEYDAVLDLLDKYGLENGWVQELESSETYRPDFDREAPFDNRELGL
ncbi:MAG: hypothetical protein HYU99_04825 [Deltaproteobacteria bacterium]|nr:hypothetical protein [Deltaproteobacteria bacterium]